MAVIGLFLALLVVDFRAVEMHVEFVYGEGLRCAVPMDARVPVPAADALGRRASHDLRAALRP
jgi:hypothetical protein